MISIADIPTASNAIRDAVTPVFLIPGIGSILGVLTNRLGRAIDRYRKLTELKYQDLSNSSLQEIKTISKRIQWVRSALSWCTLAILCVSRTIAFFFIAVEFNIDSPRAVAILFITAMLTLTCGLLCFLREIALATHETFDIDAWIKAE